MSDSFNILIQFSKLLFIVLFIAHWGGCFWFFLGTSEFQDKGTSWLSKINLIDSSTFDQYISSIYYYITTMTTVGYGDITPVTPNEKMYAMISMILACGVFAYVIGSIGTVLSSRYDEEMIFKQKIMYVDQYLKNKKLSPHVRTKVRRYLEHVLDNKREQRIDESEILNLLNKNLKEEVVMHLNGLLLKNPIFMVISKYDEFCLLLTNIMREETLNPGDIIFQKGDHSLRLYFINNGMVTMFDQDSKIVFKEINNKSPYNCFGEIGFFAGQKRCTSAESLTFTSLTYILMDLFKEIAYKFKQIAPGKFKNFEEDLLKLRTEIRGKDYSKLKLKCYLCGSDAHIAPDCTKLKSFDEYFKFNFKDKKHKTEAEIKKVYDLISRNSGSTHLLQTYQYLNINTSNPSFTKNTKDSFFSYAGVYSDDEEAQDEQLSDFDNNRYIDDENEKINQDDKDIDSNRSGSSISNKSKSNKTDNPNKSTKSIRSLKSNNSISSQQNKSNSIKKSNSSSKNHLEKNSISSKHSINSIKSHISETNSSHKQPINKCQYELTESENITIEENEILNKITHDNELLTLDDNRTKFGKLLQISEGKRKKF
jgi:CRP-like cAMP-binding protein